MLLCAECTGVCLLWVVRAPDSAVMRCTAWKGLGFCSAWCQSWISNISAVCVRGSGLSPGLGGLEERAAPCGGLKWTSPGTRGARGALGLLAADCYASLARTLLADLIVPEQPLLPSPECLVLSTSCSLPSAETAGQNPEACSALGLPHALPGLQAGTRPHSPLTGHLHAALPHAQSCLSIPFLRSPGSGRCLTSRG